MSSDLRPGPRSLPTDELASAEATLGVLKHVLHPISRDEFSKRTPCTKYDVAQLTDHLLNSITEYVLGLAKKTITPRGRSTARFADPVAVPDDSLAFDRLVAFTGRDPAGRA